MGLSHQDRYDRIARVTSELTSAGQKLTQRCASGALTANNDLFAAIAKLTKKLWPAFLKNEQNNLYWIFGSRTNGHYLSREECLWETALLNHVPKEPLINTEDSWSNAAQAKNEAYHEIIHDMVSQEYLLGKRNEALGIVLEIYQLTEAATYALRRYNDEFRKKYKKYDKIIAQIQGACFAIFSQNEDVLKAWLQANIIKILLGTNPKDTVYKWWAQENLHHDMLLGDTALPRLHAIYKEIQFSKPSSTQRILISLELAAQKFHYTHQHKNAKDLFVQHNAIKANKNDKIDIHAVEKALASIKAQQAEQLRATIAQYIVVSQATPKK